MTKGFEGAQASGPACSSASLLASHRAASKVGRCCWSALDLKGQAYGRISARWHAYKSCRRGLQHRCCAVLCCAVGREGEREGEGAEGAREGVDWETQVGRGAVLSVV